MSAPRRATVAIAVGAIAYALSAGEVVSASAVPAAGPRALTPPAGAVVAHDGPELAALLRDRSGPREIWLEAHAYSGDFVVTRPLALRGAYGATLEGSGDSTVLSIAADDVVIDNLTIRRSGKRHTSEDAGVSAKGARVRVEHVLVDRTLFGIRYEQCRACVIEAAHVRGPIDLVGMRGDAIKLWEAHDSVVRNSFVEGSRDVVVWYSRHVLLENDDVRGGRYGAHFMYAHDGTVKNCRLVGNEVGVFVMYSARLDVEHNVLAGAHGAAGVGLGFKESDGVKVRHNAMVANTTGIYFDRTPRSPEEPVVVEANRIALDEVGLRFHGTSDGVTFRDNDFANNGVVAEVDGGSDALSLTFASNHWSEHAGYDLDADGTSDVAFEVKKLASDVKEAHPSVRLFEGSVAMGLVDGIAEALPVFASRKLLVDRTPAMRAKREVGP